tara:strand:- start:49 stop:507 length:459 start_codon:yes stop_codon:yes gene_type:complete
MIQLLYDGSTLTTNQPRLNLKSYFTSSYDTTDGFLVNLKSQFTGKDLYFAPGLVAGTESMYNNRTITLVFFISNVLSVPASSIIKMGTTDHPLGFYDFSIYLNSSAGNLDPTGLTLIYSSLANVRGADDHQSVDYSEYTTNDSDTESVYITF